MKVKLSQAVKMFFGNSSFEMVFSEAIANALDAKATEINISISAQNYSKTDTLSVKVTDNGGGFTDERFGKFCNLFDVDESSHKGLGRLVYLCYFEDVSINSVYKQDAKYKERNFKFTEDVETNFTVTDSEDTTTGTEIIMNNYTHKQLHKYGFIDPVWLKKNILEEFFPRLYKEKQIGNNISINITSVIDDKELTRSIYTSKLPNLEIKELDESITLFDKFILHYSILKSDDKGSVITAITVDDRTKKVELIAKENIIPQYSMIFLLSSDWLKGRVDFSRQKIEVNDVEMKKLIHIFRQEVASIIAKKIPSEGKRIKHEHKTLTTNYPHLIGYFNDDQIGYSSRKDILKMAQDKFLKDQRDILDATELTDDQYTNAIELSSRSLMEYILLRQITINKLKSIDSVNSESDIHKIIIPMKEKFEESSFHNDLYRNNAWILDDKYMTYNTILSDEEMSEVVKTITDGEDYSNDNGRPDIVLIFSDDLKSQNMVDVVIVELKKKGVSHDDNMKVITQLETRARRLMKYYNNKIQRIWFYGIIEFNEEVELALMGEYKELYSTGRMYYKEVNIAIQKEPLVTLPIGVFIMDYDSLIKDAEARNSTFFKLIKSKFEA